MFALAVLLALLTPPALTAASFTASLDRDTVAVGDSAVLTLTFEGGQPTSIPSPPSIPNLQIDGRGTSQSINGVNGRWSSTISATFQLTPTQPGEYVIPSLRAEVDGQVLTSRPLTLKAVKAEAPPAENAGNQLAFLKMFLPKEEVYLGEVLPVQLRLFIRDGVANGDGILQSFENLGATPFKAEGCSILKTASAQRQRVQIGNGAYNVATLVTSLAPVKTGPLTINAINTTLVLQLPAPRQQRDLFDPFGMFPRYQERRVPVQAGPESINVLPLPPNPPADFNGAVGSYTLTVSAGPTNVAVGDPITVRIQISGTGAFDSLTLPDQPAWRDFKVYPSSPKFDANDALGLTGTKTFEEVAVPQNADLKSLPPVVFSYFDSDKRSYRTLTGPAVALEVRPGGTTAVPATAAANRSQETPPPSQDIVYIKQRLGEVAVAAPPLVRQPWFLTLQGLPALALLSAVVWRKRGEKLAANPRLRRRRQVALIVRKGQADLRRFAAENNSDEFFATLFRLLQEQLGERLDLPASAITEAVIEEHLQPRGVPDPVLNPLRELFQACNLARYAPIQTSEQLAAFIPGVESVLHALQELQL